MCPARSQTHKKVNCSLIFGLRCGLMDVKLYKCPNCGADLKFDPDKQLFCCDYCLGEFNQQQINQMIQQQAESQQDEQRKLNEEINGRIV